MEIILYITIFFIGLIFGSFFTLAVHRLPLHEDITHKRSYCPKCNHKLSFFDMIPILGYIFLKGRCRYCKEKIKSKYLMLEIITGIVFLLFTISIFSGYQIINQEAIIYLVLGLLYIVGLIMIAGIDNERYTINTGVLLYELVIVTTYMFYLYLAQNININRYIIYLIIMLVLLANDTLYLKRNLKGNYIMQLLILSIIMSCFVGEVNFLLTVACTLIAIAIINILYKILNKKVQKRKIPIAYFLCNINIIILIVTNFLALGGYNG